MIAAIVLAAIAATDPSQLKDGDLVFQQSRSSQSAAIAAATGSRYTHMGMVTVRDGRRFVLEAVQPVKLTPYADWVKRGVDHHVVVKRLKERLTNDQVKQMRDVAAPLLGKSYDLVFAWDDERMYCSELVYKIYARGAGIIIGTTQKLGDFDLKNSAVRKKLHERYGEHVPLDEQVISPQSMFDDPKLVVVE